MDAISADILPSAVGTNDIFTNILPLLVGNNDISTTILPPKSKDMPFSHYHSSIGRRIGRDENNLAGSTPSDRPPGPSTLPGPGILSGPGNLMCPTGPWEAHQPARLFSSSQGQRHLVLMTVIITMKCHQAETSDGPAEHFPRSRAGLTRSVEGEVEGRWMWKKDEEEVGRTVMTRSVEGWKG